MTLTNISQLVGAKNQRRPESSDPQLATLPKPVCPEGTRHASSTRKRPPARHRVVGPGTHGVVGPSTFTVTLNEPVLLSWTVSFTPRMSTSVRSAVKIRLAPIRNQGPLAPILPIKAPNRADGSWHPGVQGEGFP